MQLSCIYYPLAMTLHKHTQYTTNLEAFTHLGMKPTHARSEILAFLANAHRPTSANEIWAYIKNQSCETNKVTIYRTLDTFVEKGAVRRLAFQEGQFRYEINDDDHHHLICEVCGCTQDVSNCTMEAFVQRMLQEKDFIVKRHTLEFYGICAHCSALNGEKNE